jgi:hypothetical protein
MANEIEARIREAVGIAGGMPVAKDTTDAAEAD